MTMIRADVWQLNDNRIDEFIAQFNDAAPFLARFGGKNVHLHQLSMGNESSSRYITVVEWANYEDMGRHYLDVAANDREWQALLSQLRSPDSPVTHLRTQLASEVGHFGPRVDLQPGMRVLTRFWQVRSGRFDEFSDIVRQVSPFVEQHGAGTTLYRLTISGESSGHIVSVAAFNSMSTLGAYLDTLEADATAQQLSARVAADDSPAQQLLMRIDTVMV